MAIYPAATVERAMKIQEVILRAVSGQILWSQAAEIIGVSDRSMRRWRRRYEEYGYTDLFDQRRKLFKCKMKQIAPWAISGMMAIFRQRSRT